jgi:G:T-mismatch repair DNA endonuclease (very short patch repair protein)
VSPSEFHYCGNGELIIGGKSPDFVSKKRKTLVELFGDYWHRGEDPRPRIRYFAKYGYRTLVVWERELKNEEKLRRRLVRFLSVKAS